MSELDDLAAELAEFALPEKKGGRPPRVERIIAGFEDIQRFVDQHGRQPEHGDDRDIVERLYAVRLDRMRSLLECRELVASMDRHGLLGRSPSAPPDDIELLDEEELLAELEDFTNPGGITNLRHVRSSAEINAAEEIAERIKCEDFDQFQPLFKQAESELKAGIRQSRTFGRDTSIVAGNFFILGGQFVYVAEVGETRRAPNGESDARLRVIYANGTESNLLLRSLQRALYKDNAGRRLTDPETGPLFSGTWEDGDIESGTIYVLRSRSNHPYVSQHRDLIHKIGVTSGKVESRIANAEHDATYMLAGVDVVATYKLSGINRTKLESIFHRIFAAVQLDLEIEDRFGFPVRPREWFLVPLHVIDEAVDYIRDGSIASLVYDPATASFSH